MLQQGPGGKYAGVARLAFNERGELRRVHGDAVPLGTHFVQTKDHGAYDEMRTGATQPVPSSPSCATSCRLASCHASQLVDA